MITLNRDKLKGMQRPGRSSKIEEADMPADMEMEAEESIMSPEDMAAALSASSDTELLEEVRKRGLKLTDVEEVESEEQDVSEV